MNKLHQFREKMDRYLGYFLVVLMAVMVLDVVWGVVTRYLMGSPSSFTGELAGYLLIWVGLLGAALASGKRMHLSIDLLPDKLSPERRRILDMVIQAIIFLFALGILCIGGLRLVYITLTLGQQSPSLDIPLGVVYTVLPLSGLLIMFYAVAEIIQKAAAGESGKTKDIN